MDIKKKCTCVLLFISLGLSMYSQTVEIQCSFPLAERNEFRWFIQPMDNAQANTGMELQKDSTGIFNISMKAAADGFYKIYGTNQKVQLMIPLYLPGEGPQKRLEIQKINHALAVGLNADNQALSAFNGFINEASRTLWNEGMKMTPEELLALLKSYQKEAERLIETHNCTDAVRDYLNLWAYTSAYSDCQKLDFITKKSKEEIGFQAQDFLPQPEKVLDRKMATYFYPTNLIIISSIPKGSMDSKLDFLRRTYQCDLIRRGVEDSILLLYLNNFNYDRNFEAGWKEMQELTSKYQLNDVYLNKFLQRRFARKGSSFPEDITLMDAKGNEVKFDQFKGYYVYIDMWASWCAPCCKEVPYLQELERTLQNPKVKFVSISTDTRMAAWKKKMEALNMEGNQLIDQSGKLGEALNITGIPHFLIYDKEGRLLYYNAPRPSQGERLRKILENLQ